MLAIGFEPKASKVKKGPRGPLHPMPHSIDHILILISHLLGWLFSQNMLGWKKNHILST